MILETEGAEKERGKTSTCKNNKLDCTIYNSLTKYTIYPSLFASKSVLALGAAQVSKDKFLYLGPIQIRLMPPSLYNQPLMPNPMFRKILVKLNSYIVPAQMKWCSVVLYRMIIIFGSDQDLDIGLIDSDRIDFGAEQGFSIECPVRPGLWGDEGRSAWCTD